MEAEENKTNLTIADLISNSHPETFIERTKPYRYLMMKYRCALMEVETKLKVLNEEFTMVHSRNPFEFIKTRLKTPRSIIEKLQRLGCEISLESIERNLFDVAGIRVICSFQDDIYEIAKMLSQQDDIIIIQTKDYIKNPKPNGYRSLHLILDIPIFLSAGKQHMKVEVQFRTIAMDFWASLEHDLKYKKEIESAEETMSKLKKCADVINATDEEMQSIRDSINSGKESL